MSPFFTESGKARLIPNEIAPPATAHADRPWCTFCGHDEPGDLDSRTYLYLERRYVFACADSTMCDRRASRLTNDGFGR